MSYEPLIELTRITDGGDVRRWRIPRPFLSEGSAACEICAHEPATAMLSEYAEYESASAHGKVDGWYLCDLCGQPICLAHSYWWQYGASGSRIICKPCLDELRAIEQRQPEEEDTGSVLQCCTGISEPMSRRG